MVTSGNKDERARELLRKRLAHTATIEDDIEYDYLVKYLCDYYDCTKAVYEKKLLNSL